MNFIQKLFEKKVDDIVHSQFIRFSEGTFEDKALIKVKIGKSIKIWTGFEFANDFVKFVCDNAKGSVSVKGAIYAKKDFKLDIETSHERKKGFFIATLEGTIPVTKLKEIYEQFKLDYLLLTITADKIAVKISSKPHNPRGSYDEKFCVVTIDNSMKSLVADLLFDIKGSYTDAEVNHMFIIEGFDITDAEIKKDPTNARMNARRKGKLIRNLTIDGKKEIKETDFLA